MSPGLSRTAEALGRDRRGWFVEGRSVVVGSCVQCHALPLLPLYIPKR